MSIDKLTSIKIRQNDGTYSNPIPVSVLGENVECNNNNLIDILGNVDIQEKGNIQYQLNQLFNTKISVSELNNYVYNNLEQTVTGWLDSNIELGEGDIVIDKSLSIEGAAADAKATTDTFYTKTEMNQVIAATVGDIRWQIPQGTHSTQPIAIQGNRMTINGTINTTLARVGIYGSVLQVKTAAPTYPAYPELYLDPITSFIPGHKIKAKITLISGEYEFTGRYNYFYIDLRNIENGNTSKNPWTFQNEVEKIIDFQPQMIVFGVPQGEYNNVIIEFSMIDMDAMDKTLSIENKPADAKAVGDAVESVSSRIDAALSGNVDFIERNGYYGPTGDIWNGSATQKEKYTNKISVEAYHNIEFALTYPEEMSMWAAYCTFDADGNFISRYVFKSSGPGSSVSCKPEITPDTKFICFTYRSYDVATVVITADYNLQKLINDVVNTNISKIRLNHKLPTRACYDHLFVNNEGAQITIPHESLYHVRVSRLFGFNCIEANVHSTSDGVYIVNHLINNKFDRYFVHADGVTDISGIDVSTVTWDWIVENVRYKTSIPQYRTRPCRLEEFLGECRQQEIIPFITSSDAAAVALANQYMGKGNFIAYKGDREKCPTEVIYRWMSEPTKEDILAKCELYGKPFIYGMSNVNNFSDSELKDIVKAVHEAGYWIGVSYADDNWHKYANLGFDVNGTQARINRIDNGNICNLDSLFNFDDFIYTNAAETNGTLVFSADGTISPKISNDAFSMCAFDVEISFVGTITIPAIGEGKGAHTYSSDGSYPFFVAIPIINGSPKVTIAVNNGTIINDIKYKASKF